MKTLEMPSFGADMETGKVVEWCVQKGDKLNKGDTIALIETAKGIIDMEVFDDCVVEDFLVPLDTDIEVGKPIIALQSDSAGTKTDLTKASADKEASKPTSSEPKPNSQEVQAPFAIAADALVTPAAKVYAASHSLNLQQVKGSGTNGAICLRDVKSLTTKAVPKRGGFDSEQMRKAIAAVVSKSKREIPHYYLSLDVDLTETENWLVQINETVPVEQRVMINAPLMCAVARALQKHPEFNGFYKADHFEPANDVHLGVAIRLRNQGLVTPAIHQADRLSVFDMMTALKSIVERSKTGGLKQSELQDATVTLSNIGDRGSDQIFGVIFPPQVTIVGVGKINRKAMVINDEIVPRTMVNVSLAADHRVTDGQMGARFLNEIQKLLNKPEKLAGG